MTEKTMKEKLAEAKKNYLMDDFKKFMRKMQGLTDDDFKKPVWRIIEKILKADETDPLNMFERIMRELDSEWEGASPLPTNSERHHFIVPGVIMTAQTAGRRGRDNQEPLSIKT